MNECGLWVGWQVEEGACNEIYLSISECYSILDSFGNLRSRTLLWFHLDNHAGMFVGTHSRIACKSNKQRYIQKKLDYCFTVCFGWSYATKFDVFFFILYRFDDIVFDVGALTVSAAAAVSATCYWFWYNFSSAHRQTTT